MLKRLFDILVAITGLLVLSPLFLFLAIYIKLTSEGPVFYRQWRVGIDNKEFRLFKFRSMYVDADKRGLLTVGGKDPRVTKAGYLLRKYKFDEFPQLINVLLGDMSLVGPRPEVRKYVDYYTTEQMRVLSVKPGMTDNASIEYIDENELLAKAKDPEDFYIKELIPKKTAIYLDYVNNQSFILDIQIIFKTFVKLFR
ncbi:MAG: sugar transferase [Bacteroidetes bacterium]|nr:sugar transferase [Bacteroidota bacterium]